MLIAFEHLQEKQRANSPATELFINCYLSDITGHRLENAITDKFAFRKNT